MSYDLALCRSLLRDGARRILRAFLESHDQAPTALGFVFALYNVTPQLDLCAHLGELPDDEEERWNSGDFDFPAGLTEERDELGPTFAAKLAELHAAAQHELRHGPTYQGLIAVCAQVLLDLRHEGLVPEGIDLNVSEVGDPWERVAERHAMMERGRVPDAGEPHVPDERGSK